MLYIKDDIDGSSIISVFAFPQSRCSAYPEIMLQLATTMPSLTQVLLLPPLLVVLHLLHQYLGRLRPLNAIPNAHPTAAFSPLWLLWVRYRKRENRTVWESHQRLGPVVRLAPKEVSVCTLQGVKTIYGDWGKNEWYAAFYNYG